MVRLWMLFFSFVVSVVGAPLYAACQQPTIITTSEGPTETGKLTLTMAYNLSGASNGAVYVYWWDSLTNYRKIYNVYQPSGTITVELSAACLATGSHSVQTAARNCLGSDDKRFWGYDTTEFTVDSTPTVTLAQETRADGDYVTVGFTFPNTSTSASRLVTVKKNGAAWQSFRPAALSGTATYPVSGCPTIDATVTACSAPYTASATLKLCDANVASNGDVSTTIPLFTIGDLDLTLSYDSRTAAGWHHSFGEVLRTVNDGQFLHRTRADGRQVLYTRTSSTSWSAIRQRGARETVALIGAEYHLEDRDGIVRVFDAATGRWLRTTGRRGNAITATYAGDDLAAVTDSRGRTLRIVAEGAMLHEVTLPDGATWRFEYAGRRLAAIRDPLHASGAAWRTFTYDESGALMD